jgi:hypothetical protein
MGLGLGGGGEGGELRLAASPLPVVTESPG